jgi:predicted ATPase
VLGEILARTDGVPLFVQELTRSVLESGLLREEGDQYALQGSLEALAIPASLRDSLMARLDRLGPVKELAQIGSCIGREFPFDLLERISPLGAEPLAASLETLVEAGLTSRRDSPPNAKYTFTHALVQDAAYDSLLKTTRSELHARIADVIENDFADRVTNAPEWLAHHRTQAGHLTRAIPLWRKAGAFSVGRVAMKEAVAHFQKGLTLIELLPPSEERQSRPDDSQNRSTPPDRVARLAAPEVKVNAAAILRLAERRVMRRACFWPARWYGRAPSLRAALGLAAVGGSPVGRGGEGGDGICRSRHATGMVQHFLSGRLVERANS